MCVISIRRDAERPDLEDATGRRLVEVVGLRHHVAASLGHQQRGKVGEPRRRIERQARFPQPAVVARVERRDDVEEMVRMAVGDHHAAELADGQVLLQPGEGPRPGVQPQREPLGADEVPAAFAPTRPARCPASPARSASRGASGLHVRGVDPGDLAPEEQLRQVVEGARVAGRQERVVRRRPDRCGAHRCAGARRRRPWPSPPPRTPAPRRPQLQLEQPGQQRVVGAAHDHGVDALSLQRRKIPCRGPPQLGARRIAALDVLHEDRTGGREQGRSRPPSPAGSAPVRIVAWVPITPTTPLRVARSAARTPGAITPRTGMLRGRRDVADRRDLDRVAGHHEHLDVPRDQVVRDLHREAADLLDGLAGRTGNARRHRGRRRLRWAGARRMARATVSPPTPESNTPIGRSSRHAATTTAMPRRPSPRPPGRRFHASVERYFHPPSARRHTMSPASSSAAIRCATWMTAPLEMPAKMPSRSVSSGSRAASRSS